MPMANERFSKLANKLAKIYIFVSLLPFTAPTWYKKIIFNLSCEVANRINPKINQTHVFFVSCDIY